MKSTGEVQIDDDLGGDELIPFTYSITSYGADYAVDALVKRITQGDIFVPSFQRGFVWTYKQACSFVESLLLGLPVPGIFLSKEKPTKKLLVIDGQQRLLTLKYFYDGLFEPLGRQFVLRDVQTKFEGTTYKALDEEDRRNLDDSILHATIVQQDHPSDDDSSIFHMFYRLNTGGTQLQPQEIRACIYHGELNNVLGDMNNNEHWRKLFGGKHSRMRDQELILRFFALYDWHAEYKRPMKAFLNTYMGKHRNISSRHKEKLSNIFYNTILLIYNALGNKAFKPTKALNAAIYDSVMIGIAKRLDNGHIKNISIIKDRYDALLDNDEYKSVTQKSTADEESVKRRLSLAISAFHDIV